MASVLFIQTDWFEHLGILHLASALEQAGHSCSLIITSHPGNICKAIDKHKPDVVAMSATTGSHYRYLKIAESIKPHFDFFQPRPLIVLGGPHATFFPAVIREPGLDIICRGEGEVPLLELCQRLDQESDISSVPGLWVKQDGTIFENPLAKLVSDLDTLPLPDRALYTRTYRFFSRLSMKRVIFSRGCPYLSICGVDT